VFKTAFGLNLKNACFNLAGHNLNLAGMFQGLWLLMATLLTGVLNYLANMLVGRLLNPADYGIYAALLSLFTALTALTGVAQTLVTSYTARFTANQDWLALRGLVWMALRWLVVTGGLAALIILLIAGPLSQALQIATHWPVRMVSIAMLPMVLAPLGLGVLRGQLRFGVYGWAQVVGAAARLVGGAILVWLGMGVVGAIASLAFASVRNCTCRYMFTRCLAY
jgi:O-antigen/teichoic acid export membrane protein